MPIELRENAGTKLLDVNASGKLSKEDYEYFDAGEEGAAREWLMS